MGLKAFVKKQLVRLGLPPNSDSFFHWLDQNIESVTVGTPVEIGIMELALKVANFTSRPRGPPRPNADGKVARDEPLYRRDPAEVQTIAHNLKDIGADASFMMLSLIHI